MTTATITYYAYLNSVWTDITSDVQVSSPPNALWRIQSDNPSIRTASTGVLNFDLDNSTKKYNPDATSPLSGWGKGTAIKVVFSYNGLDRIRFRGVVEKIAIDAGEFAQRKAHITVLDWLDYAAKYPIEIPVIEEDKTADYAIQQLVDAMPIAPQNISLETGVTEFATIFDSASTKTNAYAEFVKLVNSEAGILYLEKDDTYGETLVFKNFKSRSGTTPISTAAIEGVEENLITEDSEDLLTEDSVNLIVNNATAEDVVIDSEFSTVETAYGDGIINFVTTSANPKRVSLYTSLIYSLENTITIGSGQTKTFRIQYTDPSSKRNLAALPPDVDGTIVLLKGEEQQGAYTVNDETERVWTSVDVYGVTNIKKFGTASLFFDGSNSYIYTEDSPDFDFGTRDFTIEFWLYAMGGAVGETVLRRNMTSTYPAFAIGRGDGTNMYVDMSSNGTSNDIANAKSLGTISFDTWVHYAVCREGNNFYAFKNGVLTSSWTSSASLFAESSQLGIGRNGATSFEGCIDELRIILDDARYTSAFTPPTTEFFMSGVFYEVSTAGGTDIKDSVELSIEYGGVGADVTVTNNYSQSANLTLLDIYSSIVQNDVPIVNIQQNETSISNYGYQSLDIQMPYQQDIIIGEIEGKRIVERERNPRLTMRKVTMVANQNEAMMSYFLNMDIGDLVRLKESHTEIDSLYWINGVEWRIVSGSIIEFSWYVKDFNSLLLGLSPIAIESDAGSTDGINFGYLPYVDEAIHGDFTITAWVYIDASAGTYQEILSIFSDEGGLRFGLDATDNRNLTIFDYLFPSAGVWKTTSNPVSYAGWHHVAVTYNSLASADPVFYVDGSSVALTETATPSGTLKQNTYPITVMGNVKSASNDYTRPLDGKEKDLRIYNVILTASQITTLYNSGTPDVDLVTDNLIFQAPCVKTKDLSDYINVALTNDLRVVDNIYGIVGTHNGTPTARSF